MLEYQIQFGIELSPCARVGLRCIYRVLSDRRTREHCWEEKRAPATASLVAANTHTFLEANHTTAPFYCLLLLLSHFHLAVLGGEGGSIPASASLVGANTQTFPSTPAHDHHHHHMTKNPPPPKFCLLGFTCKHNP